MLIWKLLLVTQHFTGNVTEEEEENHKHFPHTIYSFTDVSVSSVLQ